MSYDNGLKDVVFGVPDKLRIIIDGEEHELDAKRLAHWLLQFERRDPDKYDRYIAHDICETESWKLYAIAQVVSGRTLITDDDAYERIQQAIEDEVARMLVGVERD